MPQLIGAGGTDLAVFTETYILTLSCINFISFSFLFQM